MKIRFYILSLITMPAFGMFSPIEAIDTLQVNLPIREWPTWHFTTFDQRDLASSVHDIFEDQDGNIWFATDQGAQCYDGYYWKTYTTEDGLCTNRVRTVYQTRDGAMWFGTLESGISRFHGDTWTTYTTDDGLAANSMWYRGFHETEDGTLWAGFWIQPGSPEKYEASISRFDGQTWTPVAIPEESLPPRIIDIYETSDGALWFATWNHGVYRLDLSSGTEDTDDKWTHYNVENGLPGNAVIQMLESRDGDLWFPCWREGAISRFDGKQWRHYTTQDGLPAGTRFGFIWQAEDGVIWAGGDRGKFCRFDGEKWQSFTVADGSHGSIGVYICPTRDGSIWVFARGQKKVFRFDPVATPWTAYTNLPLVPGSGRCDGVTFMLDGVLWLAGRVGAVRFDGNKWEHYTGIDGLIDGQISTVLKGKDGSVWVVGRHRGKAGAAQYDGKTWHMFSEEDGLAGNSFYTGYIADNGDLWFGTRTSSEPVARKDTAPGIFRFDGHTWKGFRTEDGLVHDIVYDIAQTADGAMWFGTLSGLSRFDPSLRSGQAWTNYRAGESTGIQRNKVRTLFVDRSGNLWVAYGDRDGGVSRFDGTHWMHYTIQDGLSDNQVWGIYEDRDGIMWFGTQGGISRYDGMIWTTYSIEDMPESMRVPVRSIVQISNDTFWMGGDGGVARFKPDRYPPETMLKPTIDQVSSAGNILIKWSGRDFWNHTPIEKLRYQWRLGSEAWSQVSDEADVTLTGLATGDHLFEVRSIDRDGNIEPIPVTHAFAVQPPWWQNSWVMSMTFVLVLLVGVQTVRVVRREQALKASLETQLLQSSRLMSLGQMTAGVAHELNQPLNAVSMAAEDLYLRITEGMEVSKKEMRPILQDVLGMVDRMSDTIDHLRVFSRGEQDEPFVPFDVNEVVYSSLKILGMQLKVRSIEVALDLEEGLPVVNGHPHQVEQVLLNLIGNARDALDEQGGDGRWVRIETRSEKGDVVIGVSDNGSGMNKKTQEQIFEPFFTTKEAERGTGLGLSISYAIVKNHDGQILCESTQGTGTRFWVRLPVLEEK